MRASRWMILLSVLFVVGVGTIVVLGGQRAAASAFCATVTEIPASECAALEALYNSTDGPNWSRNDGWMVSPTPCSWYGVACSGGHVTQLSLISNRLTGNIPPALSNLPQLERLWLFENQLNGNIPVELGSITSLQSLNLEGNQLTGNIPSELGNLSNLKSLGLEGNQLTTLLAN